MSATLAAAPWTGTQVASQDGGWRFGRELPMGDAAPRALQWLMPRPSLITARQRGAALVLLAGVAWWVSLAGQGAALAAVGLELLLLAAVARYAARHAGDRETLTLVGPCLLVEQCLGRRVARTDFSADRLRVEPVAGQGSLLELSGQGQCVRVGRFLAPELRAAFARELRLALRRPAAWAGHKTDSN